MSFNTAKVPQDKSHDALQLFPHHQVHIPSAPGPSSSITSVTVPPAPSDLPIDLGQISPVAPRPSEKDHVLPSSTTDARLQSQLSQIVASNTAPADSPSSVTDSSRQPGAEHSDGDSEVLPSQDPVSAKSKKRKRTRTLTTAPQAAALFALLARVSPDRGNLVLRLTHSSRLSSPRQLSEKRLDELLVYLQGRCKSVLRCPVQTMKWY